MVARRRPGIKGWLALAAVAAAVAAITLMARYLWQRRGRRSV